MLDALKQKGIAIRVASPKLVMEEVYNLLLHINDVIFILPQAPESYKNVTDVVNTCERVNYSVSLDKLFLQVTQLVSATRQLN